MNSGAPAYPTSGIRCVTLVKNPVILAQKVVPGHLLHKFWNTGSTERDILDIHMLQECCHI
jgi:hypothetical protein